MSPKTCVVVKKTATAMAAAYKELNSRVFMETIGLSGVNRSNFDCPKSDIYHQYRRIMSTRDSRILNLNGFLTNILPMQLSFRLVYFVEARWPHSTKRLSCQNS